jgi:DNA-directed RNA polymerase specialized sigma24 family protein
MVAAIRHLEEAVLGADWTEGIVLRYGAFYGPGTSLTQLLGARQPMRVPRFIGRLFAGDVGAVMMTELRGASNPRQSSSWDGAQRAGAGGRGSWRMTDRARLFDELRPVSFAIAYRVLGSVSEAEDVVQEALLRVHRALEAGEQIASPRAFLATVTTRLAINELRSARARREEYGGGWLPEPIITDGHDDLARHALRWPTRCRWRCWCCWRVSLRSSEPCCCFTTSSTMNYPQVAEIIGKSQDNVRQLATRARRHVEQRRPRFQTTREQRASAPATWRRISVRSMTPRSPRTPSDEHHCPTNTPKDRSVVVRPEQPRQRFLSRILSDPSLQHRGHCGSRDQRQTHHRREFVDKQNQVDGVLAQPLTDARARPVIRNAPARSRRRKVARRIQAAGHGVDHRAGDAGQDR